MLNVIGQKRATRKDSNLLTFQLQPKECLFAEENRHRLYEINTITKTDIIQKLQGLHFCTSFLKLKKMKLTCTSQEKLGQD